MRAIQKKQFQADRDRVGRMNPAPMYLTMAAMVIVGASLLGCGTKPAPAPASPKRSAENVSAAKEPAAANRPAETSPAGVADAIATIDSIGDLGSKGKESLDRLLAGLGDANPSVRWHAARSIGLVGEAAASAIPRLIAALGDSDPIVVTQAAAAIGRIRSDDTRDPAKIDAATAGHYASAVKPLAECIVNKDPRVRRAALRSLHAVHPDPDSLIEIANSLLTDEDPSVVFPALHSLADMGDEAVPFLVKSLDHPKARYWATLALAEIGPAAAAAVPKVTALASKGEPEERLQAIMCLAAIGEPAAAAVDPLLSLIASKDAGDAILQPAAVYALGRIRSAKALEPLEPLVQSRNEVVSAAAAWARARIRPDDANLVEEAVDRLVKRLDSPDGTIRQGAVSGLTDLADHLPDAAGKSLAGRYVVLLEDPDSEVRRSAAVALARLGVDAVEAVTRAIEDPERRAAAIEILAEMGPVAKPALPALVAALDQEDPAVRTDAAFAIAAIGPEAADAVPALVKLLSKEATTAGTAPAADRAARSPLFTAAYALGRIGKAASPAVETIHRLIESDDPFIATVSAWAGLKIEPERKELYAKAIPLLTKALKSDRDLARMEAASALGEIGPAASPSIPMLEMVAEDDPVATVREAAEESLRLIRGGR